MNWKQAAGGAATALSIGAITVYAQQGPEPLSTMGPGMMGPGYGRGWRDDDRWGWAMMGGHGMGMMGWRGMGPGMMMDGMAMMGFGLGPIGRLDLNDSQRRQILRIEDELRRKNWELMGKMQDEMARMRDAMWSDKRDRAAILAASKRMSELRQQMLENMLDAADKAEAVLTPQQREQLRRFAQ
ncbi:MAG: Spy/CpxP family protein refolding chaperone [Burkholderiaceae bacterium]